MEMFDGESGKGGERKIEGEQREEVKIGECGKKFDQINCQLNNNKQVKDYKKAELVCKLSSVLWHLEFKYLYIFKVYLHNINQMSKSNKNDRKGRPRTTPTVPPPKRNQNFIVIYIACLHYVSQLTPNNKKGSRKDCGLSIYASENIQEPSSQQQFSAELESLGYELYLRKANFLGFLRILQGVGSKAVFYELLKIFYNRIKTLQNNMMEEELFLDENQDDLDKKYPHLRFCSEVQKELGTDFQQEQPEMKKKVDEKWDAFVTILEDSIENQWKGIEENKYEKLILLEKDGEPIDLNTVVNKCRKLTENAAVQIQLMQIEYLQEKLQNLLFILEIDGRTEEFRNQLEGLDIDGLSNEAQTMLLYSILEKRNQRRKIQKDSGESIHEFLKNKFNDEEGPTGDKNDDEKKETQKQEVFQKQKQNILFLKQFPEEEPIGTENHQNKQKIQQKVEIQEQSIKLENKKLLQDDQNEIKMKDKLLIQEQIYMNYKSEDNEPENIQRQEKVELQKGQNENQQCQIKREEKTGDKDEEQEGSGKRKRENNDLEQVQKKKKKKKYPAWFYD